MFFQKTLKRLKDLYEIIGLRGLLIHFYRHLTVINIGGDAFRFFLFILSNPKATAKAKEASKNHTFRFATIEDLEKMKKEKESLILERDIESFKSGSKCMLQLDGDKLCGYTWVHDNPLIELKWGLHLNMADDLVYNYNGFTHPDYRGLAFQGLRHAKVLELLASKGKSKLLGYVDHMNYRSLKGIRKSGYRYVGSLGGRKNPFNISFSLKIKQKIWSQKVRIGPSQN